MPAHAGHIPLYIWLPTIHVCYCFCSLGNGGGGGRGQMKLLNHAGTRPHGCFKTPVLKQYFFCQKYDSFHQKDKNTAPIGKRVFLNIYFKPNEQTFYLQKDQKYRGTSGSAVQARDPPSSNVPGGR